MRRTPELIHDSGNEGPISLRSGLPFLPLGIFGERVPALGSLGHILPSQNVVKLIRDANVCNPESDRLDPVFGKQSQGHSLESAVKVRQSAGHCVIATILVQHGTEFYGVVRPTGLVTR
jgi:hypothetical protein